MGGNKLQESEQSCAAQRRQKVGEVTYLAHIIADKQVEGENLLLINIEQLYAEAGLNTSLRNSRDNLSLLKENYAEDVFFFSFLMPSS